MRHPLRLIASSSKAPRAITAAEVLMSASCLTLLMLVMIEAVFLLW